MTNSNRRFNSIFSLEVERKIVEDPTVIYEEIVTFYSSLYKEPFSWRSLVDDLAFDSISGDDADWLERPFDEDGVTGVVQSLNLVGRWSREMFCLCSMSLLSKGNLLKVLMLLSLFLFLRNQEWLS